MHGELVQETLEAAVDTGQWAKMVINVNESHKAQSIVPYAVYWSAYVA